MVRDVVKGLEDKFDGVSERMHCTPGLGTVWKDNAFNTTIKELPRIPISGTESGITTGFGTHLYTNKEDLGLFKTLPMNLTNSNGTWKTEEEITNAILFSNPQLKRSSILRAASGRYSTSLIVNPSLVTLRNPTGMIVPRGRPLQRVKWNDLKTSNLEAQKSGESPNSPITVALLIRNTDNKAKSFEGTCELVNLDLFTAEEEESSKGGTKIDGAFRLIRIDITENSDIIKDLGLKEFPTFVMYHGGRMIYSGPIGGRKVKIGASSKPQVLLIEPDPKHQIKAEKSLKKLYCDSFLCLSVSDAMERLNQFQGGENSVSNVMDLILISDEIATSDLNSLFKRLGDNIKTKRVVICGLVNMLGDKGKRNCKTVKWDDNFCTDEFDSVLPDPLYKVVQVAMQKPIKAAAITKALSMRVIPDDDINYGLTPESLISKMNSVRKRLVMGNSLAFTSRKGGPVNNSDMLSTYVGTRLSVEDVLMRGVSLTR
jgi:hypothetical protein